MKEWENTDLKHRIDSLKKYVTQQRNLAERNGFPKLQSARKVSEELERLQTLYKDQER